MVSARARERRINQGVFVSGMTGSGKSRMAEQLSNVWRRVIYIDPTRSFENVETRATTYADAADFLKSRWGAKPFRLAATFPNELHYKQLFQTVYFVATQTHGKSDSVLLVMDEVDLWSSPNKIEESVSKLLRYGRHYGINWVATCRADVETHRDVRMNATQMILFRQGMLSKEMERMIRSSARIRNESIPEPATLEKWNTDAPAIEGRNFVALPDTFNEWLPSWEALAKVRESR